MNSILSPAHLAAFAKFVAGFPIADLAAALDGRATLDSDIDLAERLAALIATAFPPAAVTAGEIALALEALKWLLDASRSPTSFEVKGGYPDIVGQENSPNFKDR